jgi:hypothetical protein
MSKPERLTDPDCAELFDAWRCPDCHAFACFGFGPRALDVSVNMWCNVCGAGFNAAPQMRIAHRIARRATPADLYRNDLYPPRECDHCGKSYCGPAVYCSQACAEADA